MAELDDATGEVLWSRHYAGSDGNDEAVLALALDAAGDVYAVGRDWVSGRGTDLLVMRLDGDDGEIVWLDTFGGADGLDDCAWDVVVGPDQRPVVAGLAQHAAGTTSFLTVKLEADGTGEVWSRLVPGALYGAARASWLAVAEGGDVFMASRTWGGAASTDILVQRYAQGDGGTVWSRQYNGPNNRADDIRAFGLGPGGHPVVGGVSYSNMLAVQLDATDGHVRWTALYNGPAGWYDEATCLALRPDGEVVVGGYSDGGVGLGWDVALLGLDPDTGAQRWLRRWDGGAGGQADEPGALAVSAAGDLCLTGYAYSAAGDQDLLTQRWRWAAPADVPPVARPPRLVAWPNPFNPRVRLAWEGTVAPADRVTVHDARGRLVTTLRAGGPGGTAGAVEWDGLDARGRPVPAGVYRARLHAGSGTIERSLVLVR